MTRLFTTRIALSSVAIGAAVLLGACSGMQMKDKMDAKANPMSFFVTSVNPGKGGDFGGLAGADNYCKALATNVGAGGKSWHAFLSAAPAAGQSAVNARDRIGAGPWRNAKGDVIASNPTELFSTNKLNKQTALTEKGGVVAGRGDPVNMHDILTGSNADGTLAAAEGKDTTCGNWTTSEGGSAIVGHHDRMGLNESAPMKSWSSSHPTRGCSLPELKATGGAGLMYCFADK